MVPYPNQFRHFAIPRVAVKAGKVQFITKNTDIHERPVQKPTPVKASLFGNDQLEFRGEKNSSLVINDG